MTLKERTLSAISRIRSPSFEPGAAAQAHLAREHRPVKRGRFQTKQETVFETCRFAPIRIALRDAILARRFLRDS